MPNLVVEWVTCYGNTEPNNRVANAALIRPIICELRSLQSVANMERRKQMERLFATESEIVAKELCSLEKGVVYDRACTRQVCDKYGCRRARF